MHNTTVLLLLPVLSISSGEGGHRQKVGGYIYSLWEVEGPGVIKGSGIILPREILRFWHPKQALSCILAKI